MLEREIHEECGVFGVYRQEEAAMLTYFGLHALQHRGQEGAGIACADDRDIVCRKGCGLLTEVFHSGNLEDLQGHSCIGHVRLRHRRGAVSWKMCSHWWRAHFWAVWPWCTTGRL